MSLQLDGTSGIQFNDGSDQSTAATPYGRKNLIINGDMRIAQRGTSVTGITSSGYYTVDRYRITSNLGTWTQSQSTDVPSGQGFVNSFKMDCTTANASPSSTEQCGIEQKIEAQMLQHLKYGTSNAEKLTLSFWVKSNKTGTYIAWFYQEDDTRQTNKTYTINSADTWEKKTLTIDGDTSGVIDNDNGLGMFVKFLLGTGSTYTSGTSPNGTWEAYSDANSYAGQTVNLADSTSNYINITGVQLEVGDSASDFEFMPYDMELARCQRYYCQMNNLAWSNNATSTYNGIFVSLPNQMRATPTVTTFSTNTGTSGKIYYQDGGTDINSRVVTSGLDAVYAGSAGVSSNNGSNMYVKLTISSEL